MSEIASTTRLPKSSLSTRLRRLGFDPWLLLLVICLLAFGLVMVYSASWDVSYRMYQDPSALLFRQMGNLALGLLAMLVAARIPLHWLRRFALPIMVFAIIALIAVLLVGGGDEPRRSFLGGSVQPSELAKLALIIYLAVWMESKEDRLADWGYGFWPLMVIVGLVGGLVLQQPDLSAAITIGVVALMMFVLAGARFIQTLLIMVGSSTVGYLLVRVNRTGIQRWEDFVAGLVDIEKASYHVQASLQAFFTGGLLGRGLGASRGKFGLLPAPHTDSIFAIVGEELGLAGALLTLALFGLFLWRGFRIASKANGKLAMLLASGISFWIGLEAFVNMSVLLGLLPFAGNALPFISFGGSSLMTTLAGVGLLLNVSRRLPVEGRIGGEVAAIDIGGWDGGRRVSRPGRRRRARKKR
ncbi:MAG: FtsW/RodA/SpoVE family cell cycle protein [Anaerolineales bacterium]|jgi:cell division protein FtsW